MKTKKYLKCSEKLAQFDSLSGHNFVVLKCILQFAWLIRMYFHLFGFEDQKPLHVYCSALYFRHLEYSCTQF